MRTVNAWLDKSTTLFLDLTDRLPDHEWVQPSGLPGWTRAHVIAHVHHNAVALNRLVTWAATGREHRMYNGPDERRTEIDRSATRPAAELRTLVRRSAASLRAALDALTESAWDRPVVTARGRTVPAREIPWLRTREVAVHAVDLACGVTFADLPEDLVTALVVDAATTQASPDLAAWITGRATTAPRLGAWL